jgi:hypothetical protein
MMPPKKAGSMASNASSLDAKPASKFTAYTDGWYVLGIYLSTIEHVESNATRSDQFAIDASPLAVLARAMVSGAPAVITMALASLSKPQSTHFLRLIAMVQAATTDFCLMPI